ncbi:MAG: AprI/Inh family metalloprotease inhibitor [Beijerinckiaceae bacterium]
MPREAQAVITMAGAWDMSTADGARRCRVTFNRSAGSGDFMLVGIPPPCRTSMPQLGKRNGWALTGDGTIHFGPAGDDPVIVFTKNIDTSYSSGSLKLEPVGRSAHGEQRSNIVAAAAAQIAPSSPAQNMARAKFAGRYTIARSPAEVGCPLTLQTTPVRIQGAADGVWAASLAADCRDDGLKVFSPAGWRFESERIFLVAKKGHSIGFTSEQNGANWVKDPPAGRPLMMKRIVN